MSSLSFESVTKSYTQAGNQVIALNACSLHIGEGEFVSVVGPSGTGKTTLLNLAAGFERPDSGVAKLDDTPIVAPGPDRAVVFQAPTLFPWLTALNNVAQGLKIQGVVHSQRTDMAREMLKEVGLSNSMTRYPHQMSGGMQQRVGIARAIVMQPRLLLMDEPFAALDPFVRSEMQSLVLKIWQKLHITTLFITHSIDEAIRLSTKIVIMRSGSVLEELSVPRDKAQQPEKMGELRGRIEGLIESGVLEDRGKAQV